MLLLFDSISAGVAWRFCPAPLHPRFGAPSLSLCSICCLGYACLCARFCAGERALASLASSWISPALNRTDDRFRPPPFIGGVPTTFSRASISVSASSSLLNSAACRIVAPAPSALSPLPVPSPPLSRASRSAALSSSRVSNHLSSVLLLLASSLSLSLSLSFPPPSLSFLLP